MSGRTAHGRLFVLWGWYHALKQRRQAAPNVSAVNSIKYIKLFFMFILHYAIIYDIMQIQQVQQLNLSEIFHLIQDIFYRTIRTPRKWHGLLQNSQFHRYLRRDLYRPDSHFIITDDKNQPVSYTVSNMLSDHIICLST